MSKKVVLQIHVTMWILNFEEGSNLPRTVGKEAEAGCCVSEILG